jgi:hypothetical protein
VHARYRWQPRSRNDEGGTTNVLRNLAFEQASTEIEYADLELAVVGHGCEVLQNLEIVACWRGIESKRTDGLFAQNVFQYGGRIFLGKTGRPAVPRATGSRTPSPAVAPKR